MNIFEASFTKGCFIIEQDSKLHALLVHNSWITQEKLSKVIQLSKSE